MKLHNASIEDSDSSVGRTTSSIEQFADRDELDGFFKTLRGGIADASRALEYDGRLPKLTIDRSFEQNAGVDTPESRHPARDGHSDISLRRDHDELHRMKIGTWWDSESPQPEHPDGFQTLEDLTEREHKIRSIPKGTILCKIYGGDESDSGSAWHVQTNKYREPRTVEPYPQRKSEPK